jgi:hypothetical protein
LASPQSSDLTPLEDSRPSPSEADREGDVHFVHWI